MRQRLGICLAFRNTAPYLAEWLLFHVAVGFRTFYLYNNDSTDGFIDVLKPMLRDSLADSIEVNLIAWPGYYQQNAIYDDCLKRAQGKVDWLAFIDDDEFLFSSEGSDLATRLLDYSAFAGVAVSWMLYGSSLKIYHDNGLVIDRFTRRANGADQHVKCIVQPSRISRCVLGGHQFEPLPGHNIVDEQMRPMHGPFAVSPSAERLRVNHYLVKSIEELIQRRTTRDIGTGDAPKHSLQTWIRLDRPWNEIEDARANAYIPEMLHWARVLNVNLDR